MVEGIGGGGVEDGRAACGLTFTGQMWYTTAIGEKPVFVSAEIQRFKGIKQLKLPDLAQVNVIAGRNCVGKTAVLEALFLLVGRTNLDVALRILGMRGYGGYKGPVERSHEFLWAPLFYDLDLSRPIIISATESSGDVHRSDFCLVSPDSTRSTFAEATEEDAEMMLNVEGKYELEVTYLAPNGQEKSATLAVTKDGFKVTPPFNDRVWPARFLSARHVANAEEDAEQFGQLVIEGTEGIVLEALQTLEPRLKRVVAVTSGGVPMLYGDIGLLRMLPLTFMGDGVPRLASKVAFVAAHKDGIVFMDEIENGIHHSHLKHLWRVLGDTARRSNVQLWAATHSYECLAAAHEAFQEAETYDLRVIRLERVKEDVKAFSYDEQTLGAALKSELEVR